MLFIEWLLIQFQRNCLFSNERPDEFGDNYKRSDCVVSCRSASIYALCNCIPFFVPVIQQKSGFHDLDVAHKCTLQHLPCLAHYKGILTIKVDTHSGTWLEMRNKLWNKLTVIIANLTFAMEFKKKYLHLGMADGSISCRNLCLKKWLIFKCYSVLKVWVHWLLISYATL